MKFYFMKTYILFFISFLIAHVAFSQTIQGKIIDVDDKEPIMFVNITLLKNGIQKIRTTTDWEGNYSMIGLEAGLYSLEISYVGFDRTLIKDILIRNNKITKLNINLRGSGLGCFSLPIIIKRHKPLITENLVIEKTYSSEDLKHLF